MGRLIGIVHNKSKKFRTRRKVSHLYGFQPVKVFPVRTEPDNISSLNDGFKISPRWKLDPLKKKKKVSLWGKSVKSQSRDMSFKKDKM